MAVILQVHFPFAGPFGEANAPLSAINGGPLGDAG